MILLFCGLLFQGCSEKITNVDQLIERLDSIPIELIRNSTFAKWRHGNMVEYVVSDYGMTCGTLYTKFDKESDTLVYQQSSVTVEERCEVTLSMDKFNKLKMFDLDLKRYQLRCDSSGNIFFYLKDFEQPKLKKIISSVEAVDFNIYSKVKGDWYLLK